MEAALDERRKVFTAFGVLVLILAGLWIDLSTYGSAKPSGLLVAGALIALHIVWRDWPWRTGAGAR